MANTSLAVLFEKGIIESSKGNCQKAISYFELALEIDENINRIQIELAKCLYLTGDSKRAKEYFIKSLDYPNDIAVQQSILLYLQEISKKEPVVRWSASLVYDSNPTGSSDIDSININGIQYNVDSKPKASWGANLTHYTKSRPFKDLDYFVETVASAAYFDKHDNTQVSADMNIGKEIMITSSSLMTIKGLYNKTYYQGDHLLDSAGINANIYHQLDSGNTGVYGLTIKDFDYNESRSEYSGIDKRIQFGINTQPKDGISYFGEVSYATYAADRASDSNKTRGLQLNISKDLISALISLSEVEYDGVDETYSVVRDDTKRKVEFTIKPKTQFIDNINLNIVLGYSETDSNIASYTSNKSYIYFKKPL
ncbi:MAG: hypothetical protein ISR69_11135 [Gammaproteobacteria bacterium]|nr:hypothetical protein [Gammaproteobacteria bacterium]